MIARRVLFGAYDTWADWGMTLAGCTLSEAAYKAKFIEVPGRDGDLDATTGLTDGEPRYHDRTLIVSLECSAGTRVGRQVVLDAIVNALDGRRMDIVLPDYPSHYVTGRVGVKVEYNDLAHCAVTVTAICNPWRWAATPVTVGLTASAEDQTATLVNAGRRTAAPEIVVAGEEAAVHLTYGDSTWTLSAGTYLLPGLSLTTGSHDITYSGAGTLTIKYREAML